MTSDSLKGPQRGKVIEWPPMASEATKAVCVWSVCHQNVQSKSTYKRVQIDKKLSEDCLLSSLFMTCRESPLLVHPPLPSPLPDCCLEKWWRYYHILSKLLLLESLYTLTKVHFLLGNIRSLTMLANYCSTINWSSTVGKHHMHRFIQIDIILK